MRIFLMCVLWYFICTCPGATHTHTHSPVLEFLAVDAHSSLVALGNTHLVPAALNLLTRVLGGVYIWGRGKKQEKDVCC